MTSADVRCRAVAVDAALRTARHADVGACVLLPVTLVAGTLVGGHTVSIQTAPRTGRNTTAIEVLYVAGITGAGVGCRTVTVHTTTLTHWYADPSVSREASVAYAGVVCCADPVQAPTGTLEHTVATSVQRIAPVAGAVVGAGTDAISTAPVTLGHAPAECILHVTSTTESFCPESNLVAMVSRSARCCRRGCISSGVRDR